jgi:Phage terminase large subunit gpA, ATPase domain
MPKKLREFCEQCVFLKRKPMTFTGRRYLGKVLASTAQRLVLRCSRQVEKTTLLVNRILYNAVMDPGIQMLLVCPRREQASTFSNSRLIPAIADSPFIRRVLMGRTSRRLPVMNCRFANGSELFVRAAFHSADAVRGLSADVLFVDEFQDIAAGDLAVLQETLSHSKRGQIVLTGTPKLIDNHLEAVFRQSTACEWLVPCPGCKRSTRLDERVLDPRGLRCPECGEELDPRRGKWVARNPTSVWGDGFWINHLMVPWLNADEIFVRQAAYDPARFKNECLGLPCALGDHVITREEIEACCGDRPMAKSQADLPGEGRDRLIAGIDWGGGTTSATVLVIGYMRPDLQSFIVRMERFPPQEDPARVLEQVVERCAKFGVKYIAADGAGNGLVYNRLLQNKLDYKASLCGIIYSTSDQEPIQDGTLRKWTVNRSRSIGDTFTRIKKQMLHFPRVQECGTFLDEFVCELAEYDEHSRTIRYIHPDGLLDDALHATNYLQQVGLRIVHEVQQRLH